MYNEWHPNKSVALERKKISFFCYKKYFTRFKIFLLSGSSKLFAKIVFCFKSSAVGKKCFIVVIKKKTFAEFFSLKTKYIPFLT